MISFFFFSFNFAFSQLKITEIYYNTPFNEKLRFNKKENGVATGEFIDAYKHHRGEFIEIYNYSDKDISLKNWYLQDMEGVFWLPHDKIIKSGQFMVIAYSTMPAYLTEFPQLFSTTAGKEDQIILQDRILLRNKYESVVLGYSFNGYATVGKSGMIWEYRDEPGFNYIPNVWSTPGDFYTVKSIQYHPDPYYGSLTSNSLTQDLYNNYEATPNPLDATFKPPIQNYESLVINDFNNNYAYLDWTDNVNDIVNKLCPINIEKVSQTPNGSYTGNGSACFSYDSAGNLLAGAGCTNESTPPVAVAGYTTDELELIKNSITIYPNPTKASDQYNVTLTWAGPALGKIQSVQVFNSAGGQVYSYTPGPNTTTFSLQNQLPGAFVANFVLITGQVISKNILKW
ncbi:lamin tail domain-containing protein [Chryseobacterium sp. Alg-005]|uniref:lamin tail domain-containing protein n=1 Tax=Chryseobacterium sp. Alg-005 TaxID=3159516 RepID=UPI0036F38BB6